MVTKQPPIVCPVCGTVVIEDPNTLTLLVLEDDIRCPSCQTLVISIPRVLFKKPDNGTMWSGHNPDIHITMKVKSINDI